MATVAPSATDLVLETSRPMVRSDIPPHRVTQIADAVQRGVHQLGVPRAPEVETLLHTVVRDLVDAGASERETLEHIDALFRELRAPYEAPHIRLALDLLLTQTRSYALEQFYLRRAHARHRLH